MYIPNCIIVGCLFRFDYVWNVRTRISIFRVTGAEELIEFAETTRNEITIIIANIPINEDPSAGIKYSS